MYCQLIIFHLLRTFQIHAKKLEAVLKIIAAVCCKRCE